MESFGPNPMLIEDGSMDEPSSHQQASLILIHDGSGMIFNYFSLSELGRTVYGLYDPYFFSDKQWTGGLLEVAEHYWDLIRQEVPTGNIVLGGWSLGGIIAVEMCLSATRCASEYNIKGVVMLDSVNPMTLLRADGGNSDPASRMCVPYIPKYDSHTSGKTKRCIANAMRRTEQLLETWNRPDWPAGARPHQPNLDIASPRRMASNKAPPVVLLRATQHVPLENTTRTSRCREHRPSSSRSSSRPQKPHRNWPDADQTTRRPFLHRSQSTSCPHCDQQQPQQICTIDIARHRRMLGWDEIDPAFAQAVLDIPGHHYSIFATENIDELSRQLGCALDILDA